MYTFLEYIIRVSMSKVCAEAITKEAGLLRKILIGSIRNFLISLGLGFLFIISIFDITLFNKYDYFALSILLILALMINQWLSKKLDKEVVKEVHTFVSVNLIPFFVFPIFAIIYLTLAFFAFPLESQISAYTPQSFEEYVKTNILNNYNLEFIKAVIIINEAINILLWALALNAGILEIKLIAVIFLLLKKAFSYFFIFRFIILMYSFLGHSITSCSQGTSQGRTHQRTQ
ncbi:MAG: hypothetical protein GXO04_06035 [Aquificae bacterium]|nr:hypothetical protein [Aquificota bacterium]